MLVNEWLGGPAEGFLDLAIAAYLSISVPPMQVPTFILSRRSMSCELYINERASLGLHIDEAVRREIWGIYRLQHQILIDSC